MSTECLFFLQPMKSVYLSIPTLFFLAASFSCIAQDTAVVHDTMVQKSLPANRMHVRSFVLPAAAVAYGVASLSVEPLKNFNLTMQRNLVASSPHPTHIDDYLQYVPALAGHVIGLAGVHGRHPLLFDRLLIDALAGGSETVAVFVIKRIANEERPDHSDHYSFPSNHTAVAFASAELLRLEYGDVSPWYGIGGYAVAGLTAYLRLYNNEHWFGDVIASAGIGIICARAAHWVHPWVRKHFFTRHNKK
jgi:membrane-associated phospholipid phosphatase